MKIVDDTAYAAAMEKLRDEMAKESDNGMLIRIGEYMTEYLRAHSSAAPLISAEGKTLKAAADKLTGHARKLPHSGSCVVMADEDAYKVVLEFYGVDAAEAAPAKPSLRAVKGGVDTLDLDTLLDL